MSRPAFTLVEILVAMSISALILLGTFAAVSQGSDGFRRMNGKTSARVEAREGLTQLARDLESFQGGSFVYERDESSPWRRDRIAFLGRLPLGAQDPRGATSSLCQIIYELRFAPTLPGESTRPEQHLYRKIVDSRDVFEALVSGTRLEDLDSGSDGFAPVAYDVLEFAVTLTVRQGDGNYIVWDGAQGTFPDRADISLQVLGPELARRLTTEEAWTSNDAPLGSRERVNAGEIREISSYTITLKLDVHE